MWCGRVTIHTMWSGAVNAAALGAWKTIFVVETQKHMHFQSTYNCKDSNIKVFFCRPQWSLGMICNKIIFQYQTLTDNFWRTIVLCQCRNRERVFCTNMTLSTNIAGEERRQRRRGVLWGFAAAYTNGYPPKEMESICKKWMWRATDITLDSKASSTFHCTAFLHCNFQPIQTEQLILKQM